MSLKTRKLILSVILRRKKLLDMTLVREITFENAEELTASSMILQTQTESRGLMREMERSQITFMTADGITFSHPRHHLRKSKDDLPRSPSTVSSTCISLPHI